jgi:acetoin utilization protein AcuB
MQALFTMKVKDLMTKRGLVTASPRDTLDLAAQVMLWAGVSHLPVLREGRLVGVLAERDLIGRHKEDETVDQAMTVPAASIGPDADVDDAARVLIERGVSYLPVVDSEEHLVGVLTAGDLLAHGARRARRVSGPPARGLGRREVRTIKPADDLVDAVARMSANGFRHLPVVDGDGRLVGMLSDRDVRTAVGSPTVLLDNAAARARVRGLKVGDVMTRDPITVGQEASFADLARCLADHRIGAVPVVAADGKILAIVSYVDILHVVAAG